MVFLIFCCRVTNHHKFSCLKQRLFIISRFWRWEFWEGWTGFSAWGPTSLKPRCWRSCALIWKLWGRIHYQAHSVHCQNSVLGSWRTEVLVSMLAISQALLSMSKDPLHSLACGPLHPQSQQWHLESPLGFNLWLLLMPLAWLKSLLSKGSCN